MNLKNKIFTAALSLLFICVILVTQTHAIEIKQVKSRSGITALLVEDYTLPLISLAYSFAGGAAQDPAQKTGAVRLMSALIDEGAGEMDSVAFRSRLEEYAIDFGFSASRDYLFGNLRTVRSDRKLAFEMLELALNEPRFDDDAIERMRDAIRTGIIRSRTSPGAIASKAARETLFADHTYSWPVSGDEKTIDAISREDILQMHEKLFARDKLVVGVVGAINEQELSEALDKIFGRLAEKSQAVQVADIEPKLGDTVSIEMAVPNASISLVYKGLRREDPDFFAAYLLNYILGGSAFSSRLYDELREKRGLVYSVSSSIATPKHSAYLSIGTSTRAENRDEAISLIRQEVQKLAENGVTQSELETAKKFIIGSYAINNLDTSAKIAQVLVAIQNQKLGTKYIEERKQLIESVTLEKVNQLARELFSTEPAQIVVGPATQ